jgi:hypothetical protein
MLNEYYVKEQLLSEFGEKVLPMDFYRDVFPIGSFEREGKTDDCKANGILCSVKDGKGRHSLIFDDLKTIQEHLDDSFVILSPIGYFGRSRSAYNASMLYGIVFDLDNVGKQQLLWILERLENPHFPRATYIANSGGGLHLYYLFDKPIPLYKSIHKKLNAFKHDMTTLIWNKYTSRIPVENRQYQGIFQGFRMIGSQCKSIKDCRVTVYKTGGKVDIDYLNQFVNEPYKIKSLEYESSMSLQEAKEKYPKWYENRVQNGAEKGKWAIKRDLYDWWLNRIRTDKNLQVGHRYWCICVLASYAYKCSFFDEKKNPNPVTEDELRKDAYSLMPIMRKLQDDFTDDDVESALNFFQECYITFPRDEVAKVSGLDMPVGKRNGRKQVLHLKLARANRDILQEEKGQYWYDNSPHTGRKSKQDIVQEWKKNNPNGKKIDCSKDTGVHINTVYKWWN